MQNDTISKSKEVKIGLQHQILCGKKCNQWGNQNGGIIHVVVNLLRCFKPKRLQQTLKSVGTRSPQGQSNVQGAKDDNVQNVQSLAEPVGEAQPPGINPTAFFCCGNGNKSRLAKQKIG